MHYMVTLIAKRQGTPNNRPMVDCCVPYVQGSMQNYYQVQGLTGNSLSITSYRVEVRLTTSYP